MKIHLIAIGGAVMHNLALALQKAGHDVSGSDDEIYNPAHSRLKAAGLLPEQMGWNENRITDQLDQVILGMHARKDNPELLRAQSLQLPIYSFPEFVYLASQTKQRVVIAGSHGKTSTTSLILHGLRSAGKPYDYLVGAQLQDFEHMVSLSDASILVAEGDEYLSSALDRRPKFIHYKAHIGIITGIAWDHMNVFPTFESYLELFRDFILSMESGGTLYYYQNDPWIDSIISTRHDLEYIPYDTHPFIQKKSQWFVQDNQGNIFPTQLIGRHNMQNIQVASLVCQQLGLSETDFLKSLSTFQGAAKRLQMIKQSDEGIVIQDFAHAPSKVKATIEAVRATYPDHCLIAVVELHTYSSLNQAFIPQYKGTLDQANKAVVFYQQHTLEMKRLPSIDSSWIREVLSHSELDVLTEPEMLKKQLLQYTQENQPYVLLMMSSGTFGGLDFSTLG